MKKKTVSPRRREPSKALAVVRKPAPRRAPRQELVLSSEAAAMLANPIRQAQERAILEAPQPASHVLTDVVDMGDFATEDPELTPEENKILDEPVRSEDVQILPTGQVYLSHPTYTRWLNRALGRLKWKLVPSTTVQQSDGALIVLYFLYIRGKRAAYAYGEQAYHENNKDQSRGDAVEATHASGLRRCCKHLGMGLELWEREWTDAWVREHAVKVYVKDRDGRTRAQWRKKTAPPFWNEERRTAGPAPDYVDEATGEIHEQRTARPAPPAGSKAETRAMAKELGGFNAKRAEEPITEPQRARLWTIAKHAGRTDSEVKAWLAGKGIDSSKDIKRKDYDAIVKAIEAPGALGGDREPGQEG